jgi:hypothetical protein
MKRIGVFGLVGSLCLSLIMAGCILPPSVEKPGTTMGTLTITLASDLSRNLAPGVLLDVAQYAITGTGPGNAGFSGTVSAAEATFTRKDLEPGNWTVTVTGKNTSGTSIVYGAGVVVVEAAKSKDLPITCLPFSGTGTLDLSLSWPTATIGTPNLSFTLTPKSGGANPTINFNTESSGGTTTATSVTALPKGYYTLNIVLRDDYDTGKLSWNEVRTVLILANETTYGEWALSESNLSLFTTGTVKVAISSDPRKPLELDLDGELTELAYGTMMTVTAKGAPAGSSYVWYLDSQIQDGWTTETVTVGEGLAEGLHWLYVVAVSGEVAGSTGYSFRVVTTPEIVTQWSFETQPKVVDSTTNTYTVAWGPLHEAISYDIYQVTAWNPVGLSYLKTETVESTTLSQALVCIVARDAASQEIDRHYVNGSMAMSMADNTFLSGNFVDDFSAPSLNPAYQLHRPEQIALTDGYLQLSQNVTDGGPLLRIPYDTLGKRYLSIRLLEYHHKANDYYSAGLHINDVSNANSILQVNTNIYSVYDTGLYGFIGGHDILNADQEYLGRTQTTFRTETFFDQWIDVQIIIDMQERLVTAYSAGAQIGSSHSFQSNPPWNSMVVLSISPYGWNTGHFRRIDELRINAVDDLADL